ncbi:hypothetical protein J8L73_08355 [Pseudoalteromonas sp. MMG006]|uniref:oxidoreductase-like domain-containing protein n=1 Tax=Pseudoalteromonas sp. MMG006 TaxID=2822683 RepID=UPI001B3726FC|nr:oxidoreductase-like domain-containing protein [Pseudoalteromonas sp. MMG006]MBQ4799142.1 hypothetical protein [Pseudoalteromonas sp. MMG006]
MQNNECILLSKPEKPKPDECCGGGSCSPCVWDEYKQALNVWQAQRTHKNLKKHTN